MKKIKIIDVAEHAGVSKSTISQFLSGRFNYMSATTRARIESSIKELDYVPNPIARSLKTDKTKTIGVIVRDISGPYTSRALRGIDDFCKSRDYNVLIYSTDFNAEMEAHALKTLRGMHVDGLIIAASGKNLDLMSKYIAADLPLVQFQMEFDECASNMVLSNHRKAAFEATEYLIKLGHTRICFATQQFAGIRSREDRYLGYIDALNKHGIKKDELLIQYWERDKGFNTPLSEIIAPPIAATAIFAQHLAVTTDVIKGLKELNIEIPTDISLLGYDEIPMIEHFKVPITLIEQDPYNIGLESAKLLFANINKEITEFQTIITPYKLVERDSCRKLN